jgi:ElaB/YqjD/DUF883 family membrane-anchored ribosome-binding protein
MDKTMIFFVAVTSVAVFLQMVILAALYFAVRQSSQRMDALAKEVKDKAIPAIEKAHEILTELRPQVATIAGNLTHSTNLVRGHMTRLDATVHDILDRTRLQVIRADELVSRTMDGVEETTDVVHKTVMSPVRQLAGIMHGISVGLDLLLGRGRKSGKDPVGVPQDEMFI